jgi:hypothetical protein
MPRELLAIRVFLPAVELVVNRQRDSLFESALSKWTSLAYAKIIAWVKCGTSEYVAQRIMYL